MYNRLEASAKLAETHTFHQLRELSLLAMQAMSFHIIAAAETTNFEQEPEDRRTGRRQLQDASDMLGGVMIALTQVKLAEDLKSSGAEIAAVRQLIESANDPDVARLNRVFYGQ